MIKETLNYFDRENSKSVFIREEEISAETEMDLFIEFYKKNNRLRYCNGAYYKFKNKDTEIAYKKWLKSPEYEKISFQLYYGGGVVD